MHVTRFAHSRLAAHQVVLEALVRGDAIGSPPWPRVSGSSARRSADAGGAAFQRRAGSRRQKQSRRWGVPWAIVRRVGGSSRSQASRLVYHHSVIVGG